MRSNPILLITKAIVVIILVFQLSSCHSNSAEERLQQMEIVISKWESELHTRKIDFEDLVHIQTDITAFDVDQPAFESVYGTLTGKQQNKLTDLRSRFRKLLKKDN